MWKLVIHQERKYEGFTSDHRVELEAEYINELLNLVRNMSDLFTNEKTWYEIREVEE